MKNSKKFYLTTLVAAASALGLSSCGGGSYYKDATRGQQFNRLDKNLTKQNNEIKEQLGSISQQLVEIQDWQQAATEILTPEQQRMIKATVLQKQVDREYTREIPDKL